MRLRVVENPLLEVLKHADLDCMEEVELWAFAHSTRNVSKFVEYMANMMRREFSIGCVGVSIDGRSI